MHNLPRPQSLAIVFWGLFELIIEESGDETSDGKGRKSEALFSLFSSHHSPLSAVRSFPSSPSRASRFSPALAFIACSRFVLSIKPWERLWSR